MLVEWSPGMGGGGFTVRTDREGRYAARRTIRSATQTCAGMTITVRAPYYASAYNAYSDSTCGEKGVLTLDFKLIPLPR